MSDKKENSGYSDRFVRKPPKLPGSGYRPAPLAQVGGEPLQGSGFETEIAEPDSEWRDPR